MLQAQSLIHYNTFGIDATCDQLFRFTTEQDIQDWLAGIPVPPEKFFVLGGGSNLLLIGHIPLTFIQADIQGIEYKDCDQDVMVTVGAGVDWHELVLDTLERGYSGLENLSLIPGNVGASPIQNIGAYGVELEQVFERLVAIDLFSGERKIFTHSDCEFSYRDSVFKHELRGKYVITSVTLRLKKAQQLTLAYGPLKALQDKQSNLTAKDVSDEVIRIRQSKLPNPAELGNAGSFFKNPIISNEQYEVLKSKYPELVAYPNSKDTVKVAAGWLIEQSGLKGYRIGDAGVHDKQALVLVNHGHASGEDILKLAAHVRECVSEKFGVELEPEVWIIGEQDVF